MNTFIEFILFGFAAQLIDGSLGMAFGVFLTTVLTYTGVPVVQSSACVHLSETVISLASGIAHFKFKNKEKNLLSEKFVLYTNKYLT